MSDTEKSEPVGPIQSKGDWGALPQDNFGYASNEERREKRGLEDWEMIEAIPESQERVPPWFFAVIGAVLLMAIGLSFPFWGVRPGHERPWLDWGLWAGDSLSGSIRHVCLFYGQLLRLQTCGSAGFRQGEYRRASASRRG